MAGRGKTPSDDDHVFFGFRKGVKSRLPAVSNSRCLINELDTTSSRLRMCCQFSGPAWAWQG
eukprot:12410968-Karenia_brevis.AAC.1